MTVEDPVYRFKMAGRPLLVLIDPTSSATQPA